jgi:hypothetical protein
MLRRLLLPLPILAALAVGCGETDSSPGTEKSASSAKTTTTPTATAAAPKPKPQPKTVKGRISQAVRATDAGGYVGELKLKTVERGDAGFDIYLKTPEGGFDGASVNDLNKAAGAAFAAAYGRAGYARAVTVVFQGGLVDTTTGKDLPDVNTGIFSMSASHAREIDWSDEDALLNIDWANFRDFAHPALKQ